MGPYEQIPRRRIDPRRRASYRSRARYRRQARHLGFTIIDRPRAARERAHHPDVGNGGLDIPQARGTPVPMIELDHQQGGRRGRSTGPALGNTVVTRHHASEGGGLRESSCCSVTSSESRLASSKGGTVRTGDVVGTVGDKGSPELSHLTRRRRVAKAWIQCMSAYPTSHPSRTRGKEGRGGVWGGGAGEKSGRRGWGGTENRHGLKHLRKKRGRWGRNGCGGWGKKKGGEKGGNRLWGGDPHKVF